MSKTSVLLTEVRNLINSRNQCFSRTEWSKFLDELGADIEAWEACVRDELEQEDEKEPA